MANRFTATEKWVDPWFCGLNEKDKLFWIYLVDNCDHAGMWQVNWPLVNFHIKDYVFNEKVFNGRVVILKDEKWFIPKFIEFQYKTGLNPENRAHLSVINILKKEGAYKGLERGLQARKDKDKDKDMVKDKVKEEVSSIAGLILKNSFLTTLKTSYPNLNLDSEIRACVTWHKVNNPKCKNWTTAINNWLKKSHERIGVVGENRPQITLRKPL